MSTKKLLSLMIQSFNVVLCYKLFNPFNSQVWFHCPPSFPVKNSIETECTLPRATAAGEEVLMGYAEQNSPVFSQIDKIVR